MKYFLCLDFCSLPSISSQSFSRRMSTALTENIALLSLYGTTFELMTKTDASQRNSTEVHEYTLSFQHEQQIAEAFAVLLANTDNPSAVGAICLEEQPNGTGLLMRTAVNSGQQEARIASFSKIAASLQKCTSGPFSNVL